LTSNLFYKSNRTVFLHHNSIPAGCIIDLMLLCGGKTVNMAN